MCTIHWGSADKPNESRAAPAAPFPPPHHVILCSFPALDCRADDKPAALLYLLREVVPAGQLTIVFTGAGCWHASSLAAGTAGRAACCARHGVVAAATCMPACACRSVHCQAFLPSVFPLLACMLCIHNSASFLSLSPAAATRHHVEFLQQLLAKEGIEAAYVHGNMDQARLL